MIPKKFLLLLLSATISLAAEPFFREELIFPLESWHNHASSIVECPDGSLLVCWFHGSGERSADDVVIQAARKSGGKWSKRFTMADTPGFPDCNPTLFIDPQKRLWLFWTLVVANRWESSLAKYRIAEEYQHNAPPKWIWQDCIHVKPQKFYEGLQKEWPKFLQEFPQNIPDLRDKTLADLSADEEVYYFVEKKGNDKLQQRIGWMTRVHPQLLPSGKLLVPLYTDAYSISLVAITNDWGKTWQFSNPIAGFGNIQASIVRQNDGTLVAMMRENGPQQHIRLSTSSDEGTTWSSVTNMQLPNPGSSVECIRLDNGNWLLMYNDTVNGRHSLCLSISPDEGKTWKWHRHLERVERHQGSFSYPSLMQAKNGRIHATYSYHLPGRRKSIKHVEFDEQWVIDGDREK